MNKGKIDKYVGRSYARNNFPSLVNTVRDGNIVVITDRGTAKVALVPMSMLKKGQEASMPISKSSAFGLFANKSGMKDSVKWVRKVRNQRVERIYGASDSD